AVAALAPWRKRHEWAFQFAGWWRGTQSLAHRETASDRTRLGQCRADVAVWARLEAGRRESCQRIGQIEISRQIAECNHICYALPRRWAETSSATRPSRLLIVLGLSPGLQ